MFFDNLQVRHDRGRIIEENHYYAHGLKIAAISSKAYGALNNNYGYQGDFSEMDDDLGWNDFELRSYDPQIGRFLQNDPYDQFASGYVGMGNDPVNNVDPSGGFIGPGFQTIGGFWNGSFLSQIGSGFSLGINISANAMSWAGIAMKAICLTSQGISLGQNIRGHNQNARQAEKNVNGPGGDELRNVLVTVTGEIVGTARTFSYPFSNSNDPSKMIRYEVPVYKVIVSGTDDEGNKVSKEYRALRFGVKNSKYGEVKDSRVVGLEEEETFEKVPWDDSYKPHSFESNEKGAWVVDGDYLIHDGPDEGFLGASNGCVEPLGKNKFNEFNDDIIRMSGSKAPTRSAQLKEIGKKGALTVKYEKASKPSLKVFKKPK